MFSVGFMLSYVGVIDILAETVFPHNLFPKGVKSYQLIVFHIALNGLHLGIDRLTGEDGKDLV